jgi:hypothetical protein
VASAESSVSRALPAALLLGCGLKRAELIGLKLAHLQQRGVAKMAMCARSLSSESDVS